MGACSGARRTPSHDADGPVRRGDVALLANKNCCPLLKAMKIPYSAQYAALRRIKSRGKSKSHRHSLVLLSMVLAQLSAGALGFEIFFQIVMGYGRVRGLFHRAQQASAPGALRKPYGQRTRRHTLWKWK